MSNSKVGVHQYFFIYQNTSLIDSYPMAMSIKCTAVWLYLACFRGLPPPVKLESRHITFTVMVQRKPQPKNKKKTWLALHFCTVWSSGLDWVSLFFFEPFLSCQCRWLRLPQSQTIESCSQSHITQYFMFLGANFDIGSS